MISVAARSRLGGTRADTATATVTINVTHHTHPHTGLGTDTSEHEIASLKRRRTRKQSPWFEHLYESYRPNRPKIKTLDQQISLYLQHVSPNPRKLGIQHGPTSDDRPRPLKIAIPPTNKF